MTQSKLGHKQQREAKLTHWQLNRSFSARTWIVTRARLFAIWTSQLLSNLSCTTYTQAVENAMLFTNVQLSISHPFLGHAPHNHLQSRDVPLPNINLIIWKTNAYSRQGNLTPPLNLILKLPWNNIK